MFIQNVVPIVTIHFLEQRFVLKTFKISWLPSKIKLYQCNQFLKLETHSFNYENGSK